MTIKRVLALAVLVAISLTVFAYAADSKRSKPNTAKPKVEADREWSEELIHEGGFRSRWCGERKLFFSTRIDGFKTVDIVTKKLTSIPRSDDYQDFFVGCLSNGKYIVFYRRSTQNKSHKLSIYDSKISKYTEAVSLEGKEFPYNSALNYSLLSPDKKKIAWTKDGKIAFGKHKIKLIPALNTDELMDFAWTPDSKKIFYITGGRPQALTIFDIKTGGKKSFLLNIGKHYARTIMVSPDGKRAYMTALLGESSWNYLYRIDVDKINFKVAEIAPKFISRVYEVSFGLNKKLIITKTPTPDARSSKNPNLANLFLADMDGNILTQLTVSHDDGDALLSEDGKHISFVRITTEPGNWKTFIYILKNK